jgi:hypothetical protein
MITELKAPKGKYRVVGVDIFSNEDYLIGDFKSYDDARKTVTKWGEHAQMTKIYLYDDKGRILCEAGSY